MGLEAVGSQIPRDIGTKAGYAIWAKRQKIGCAEIDLYRRELGPTGEWLNGRKFLGTEGRKYLGSKDQLGWDILERLVSSTLIQVSHRSDVS